MKSYYRNPAIHGDQVLFISENDLWTFDLKHPVARRLTANLGSVGNPCFSPDGKQIAIFCTDEGHFEVYALPSAGGEARRLTWLGASSYPIGWKDGRILMVSNAGQPFPNYSQIYSLDPAGGDPVLLPYGRANAISFGKRGVVLGRNLANPARWKRYRGGTAGHLLIDRSGTGKFGRFLDLKGNFDSPMWIGERVYFLCDHEGIGNLYSCKLDGKDLKRHSDHKDYYARNASTDGKRVIWQAGADLWILDVATGKAKRLDFEYNSPIPQRQRKFVPAAKHLDTADISPDGGTLSLCVRGKAYTAGNWDGSAQQYGAPHGIRYRLPQITPDGKNVLMLSDEPGYERFELHPLRHDFAAGTEKTRVFETPDLGRVYSFTMAPKGSLVACDNHRNELVVLDTQSGKFRTADRNQWGMIQGYDWSPDGRWLAYGIGDTRKTTQIRIWDSHSGKSRPVTVTVLEDANPVFDPGGKYLYFISARSFNILADTIQQDFIYPNAYKPYLLTLRKDLRSPFNPEPAAYEPKPDTPPRDAPPEELKPVEIDFDGIADRVVEFPVAAGIFGGILAAKDRVFYHSIEVADMMSNSRSYELRCWDFAKQEGWTYLRGIQGASLARDGSALLLSLKDGLRVVSAKLEPKAELPPETECNKKTGHIDLDRFSVEVMPLEEWKQMFREAWRLQKYYYWREDMAGIDWQKVFDRYYPLVERCGCRADFSDLMWEMQGELGTSHCYEFGGDYRPVPQYRIGRLGLDCAWDSAKKGYAITRVVRGDHWLADNRSPLMNPGLGVAPGWVITAVNGQPVGKNDPPHKLTVNLAGKLVRLSLKSPNGREKKVVAVRAMQQESSARYRDWVEANRAYVHTASKGKLGYLHLPNMQADGLKEFHRYFLAELDHDGLVVDVRNNGGGSVSGLLLQKLARRRIGYDTARWWGASPYPDDAPKGPMVCLTDEYAGSDGDIFSHSFKLLGLGKLVGKRTWGGVIGIWPRHWLVDGTVTTQPEFSFWFKDVGWGVENYGTDPDIEVDILPQDFAAGKDPQLDAAIKVALAEIVKHPPLKAPNPLTAPKRTLP